MGAVEEGPRGVLGLRAGQRSFEVTRRRPGAGLAELVEHYWTVRWDLTGRDPHTQHTLPHPSVHLVAERDRSEIMGVLTGRFTRELEGQGRAFGIKFRPAGFHPFLGAPVSTLTDRRAPVAEVFGPAGDGAGRRPPGRPRRPGAGRHRRGVPPGPPPRPRPGRRHRQPGGRPGHGRPRDHPGQAPHRPHRHRHPPAPAAARHLTGVTPKWVIQRSRLHEAVERLDQGDQVDLGFLARDLGYFDQAHFARDFRSAVGRPPTAYANPATDQP